MRGAEENGVGGVKKVHVSLPYGMMTKTEKLYKSSLIILF